MSSTKKRRAVSPPPPAPASAPSSTSLPSSASSVDAGVCKSAAPDRVLELPAALQTLILEHLPVADFVRADTACRRLQRVTRSATPADSTICLDVADYHTIGRTRPLAPLPPHGRQPVLRFVPRRLRLRTENNTVTPRIVTLAIAVHTGVAVAAAERGVSRLHTLETSGFCCCNLTRLAPLLPVVAALRIRDAFVPFHDCLDSFCRGLVQTPGLATLDLALSATDTLFRELFAHEPQKSRDEPSALITCKLESQRLMGGGGGVFRSDDFYNYCTRPIESFGWPVASSVDDLWCTVRRLRVGQWRVTSLPVQTWALLEAKLRVLSIADVHSVFSETLRCVLCGPIEAFEVRNGFGSAVARLLAAVADSRDPGGATDAAAPAPATSVATLATLAIRMNCVDAELVSAVARFTALRTVHIGGRCAVAPGFPRLGALRALVRLDLSRVEFSDGGGGGRRSNSTDGGGRLGALESGRTAVDTDADAIVAARDAASLGVAPLERDWEAELRRNLADGCVYVAPLAATAVIAAKSPVKKSAWPSDDDEDEQSMLGPDL